MAKTKILVVEDEIIIARAIQDALKSRGYDVPATVSSGAEAIQKAAEIQPDLILMDIVLKGSMDGIEAAEQIHSRFDIPVVYLTAYTDSETVQRAKITEPFAYVTKPFEERELCTNIEMALYKHKMDKALRKSESEKQLILRTLSEQITYLDKNLRIVWANRAAGDAAGGPPEQMAGHYCYEVWHGRQEPCVDCSVVKSIETGEPAEGERTLLDGRIWYIRANPVRDEKGEVTGVVEIALDITQRKRAEEELENIFNLSPDMICVCTPEGKFLKVSPSCQRVLGYTQEEILKLGWAELVHPDNGESTNKEVARQLKGGPVANFVNRYKHKDGSYRILEWQATPSTNGIVYATARDITERKKIEEAFQTILKATSEKTGQEFFDTIVSVLSDWLGTEYALVGEIVNGNVVKALSLRTPDGIRHDYSYELVGTPCENAVGDGFCFYPASVIEKFPDFKDLADLNIDSYVGIKVAEEDSGPLGLLCAFSTRELKLPPKARSIMEIMGTRVLAEIERKGAEAEREKLMEVLAEKNRELEEIIRVATHDLRTPMVNIEGFGRILTQSCEQIRTLIGEQKITDKLKKQLDEVIEVDIPESVGIINSGVSEMNSLLDGLLRLAKVGYSATEIVQLDMNTKIENIIDAMRFQVEQSGAEIKVEPLPSCLGDKLQINQVFSNLLANALKCIDPSRPGRVRISGHTEKDYSVYCVQDNGVGIKANNIEEIFKMSYRVRPADDTGEGLGLAIVRRIVSRHNGQVWAESEAGKGSKFFVKLPRQ